MNDKQIAMLIMAQIAPLMPAGVALARNFQPTPQGAATLPYVYFFKIGTHRHGSPQRKDVWNATAQAFDHIESQKCEDTYQFSAWVPQVPTDTSALTESDVLNTICGIMQSDTILAAFRAAGVGILRVTDVRNPYIVDDRDRFEAVPTFDIVLTHDRQTVTTLPAVDTYEARVSRV